MRLAGAASLAQAARAFEREEEEVALGVELHVRQLREQLRHQVALLRLRVQAARRLLPGW